MKYGRTRSIHFTESEFRIFGSDLSATFLESEGDCPAPAIVRSGTL